MTTGDKIFLGCILILAAWFIMHWRKASPGTRAFADELIDIGVGDLSTGLIGI